MLKRILTSIVGVAILLPVLIFSDTFVLPIAVSVVTVIALFEMFNCVGLKGKYSMTIPALLAGVAFPIIAKLVSSASRLTPIACAFLMLYAVYVLSVCIFGHKTYTVSDAALVFMTTAYIIGGFVSIVLLREISDTVYLLVFIGAWMTDIFAYFSGRLFGKHKLCETISPKKTIEGSIGGSLFCAISFVVFALVTKGAGEGIGYYAIYGAVGLVISVVSQLGDLAMSLIKRQYKIKDFGKIFPGHGGILDRFDSVIAVSLVLFIIISVLSAFNVNII